MVHCVVQERSWKLTMPYCWLLLIYFTGSTTAFCFFILLLTELSVSLVLSLPLVRTRQARMLPREERIRRWTLELTRRGGMRPTTVGRVALTCLAGYTWQSSGCDVHKVGISVAWNKSRELCSCGCYWWLWEWCLVCFAISLKICSANEFLLTTVGVR